MIREAIHFPDIFKGFQDRHWKKKVTSLDLPVSLVTMPRPNAVIPDQAVWTRSGGPGGGEGAKLGDIYPTTFGELFESAEQRRGSFALAFRTASGLLASPPS